MSLNRRLVLAVFASLSPLPVFAVEDITVIGTTITTGTPSISDGYTFENGVQSATSFSTATGNYIVASLANNVFVRRNGTTANNSSVWHASSGTGTNLSGVDQTAYDRMLLDNNIYQGSDNTFSNEAGPTGANIERLDFTWNAARTASSTLRFGVFDRGAVGVHDSFAIAAITAIDAFGNPTAYGTLLKVAAGWGGTANAFGAQAYRLFRYNNGNDITTNNDSSSVNTQGVGGILITTADLGIANGTAIFGYSLMSNDVTDPLNVSAFPTTTDGQTAGGGIDLASINGLEIQAIPEPSSILLTLAIGLPLAAKLRRKKLASCNS